MTVIDASLDYWSDREVIPMKSRAPFDFGKNSANTFTEENAALVTSQERRTSRSRYLRFLLLNIILWPILVFVGLEISDSHAPGALKAILTSTGVESMSADQLVAVVKEQERTVFWLNRLSGDTYSDSTATNGVDIISYRPEGARSGNVDKADLVIKTYRDSNGYDAQLRPLEASAPRTVETLGGIKVSYDSSSLDHAVVYFDNRPQVVVIQYPSIQSVSTLINDAQNLEPIK